MRALKLMLPLTALGVLSACAPTFEARVARFQQMPAPQSQSFTIEPHDQANRGGL